MHKLSDINQSSSLRKEKKKKKRRIYCLPPGGYQRVHIPLRMNRGNGKQKKDILTYVIIIEWIVEHGR